MEWGDGVTPVAYGYEQGRRVSLTTRKDFANGTGEAVRRCVYDPQTGRVKSKIFANGDRVDFDTSPAGKILKTSYPSGLSTSYTYNNAGELSGLDYSDDTPDVTFTTNRVGQRTDLKDGSGERSFQYSAHGDLESTLYTAGPITGWKQIFRYDNLGRILEVESGFEGSTTLSRRTYDERSRLASVGDGVNDVSYAFHPDHQQLASKTFRHFGQQVLDEERQVDELLRLTSIVQSKPNGQALASHAYQLNIANQRTRTTQKDGSHWNYQYDSLGQLSAAKRFWQDGAPVAGQSFEYGQDDVGNLVTTVVNNRQADYLSNLANQYTQRTVPGAVDVFGLRNIGSDVLVNDVATQRRGRYFYNTQPVDNSVFAVPLVVEIRTGGTVYETRLAFVPKNPEDFVHDDRGNLLKDGQWNYAWNGLNQLVSMQTRSDVGVSPIVSLEFAYDSEGRRWKKTVWKDGVLSYERRFLYDNWNLIAELDGNNAVLKTYTWGTDLSGTMQGAGGVGGLVSMRDHVSGASYFYLHDGNGNVVGLVDAASGELVKEYEYGPFGKVLVETGNGVENSFKFSTKYEDKETGLLYYGYRYYSVEMGRWISRDPIAEQGGVNLYGFCGNDPVDKVDYLGYLSISPGVGTEWGEVREISDRLHGIVLARVGAILGGVIYKLNNYNQYIQEIKNHYQFNESVACQLKIQLRPALQRFHDLLFGMKNFISSNSLVTLTISRLLEPNVRGSYESFWNELEINENIFYSNQSAILNETLFHEISHEVGTNDATSWNTSQQAIESAHNLDDYMNGNFNILIKFSFPNQEIINITSP